MRSLVLGCCLGLAFLAPSAATAAQGAGDKKPQPEIPPDGLKALKHSDPQVRYNALELLGRLGKTGKFAEPDVRELLKDPNVSVRIKAAETLLKIDQPESAPLVAVLVEAAKHEDDNTRALAFHTLAAMGGKAKAALPAIKKGLKDKVFGVRLQAVLAAGAVGPAAKTVVPELVNIMQDDDTGLLEAQVTLALSKIGPAAIPYLRKALADGNTQVRRGSAFALGLMGGKASGAVPDLTKALADAEPVVRALAAEALGKIGQEASSAAADLRKTLDDQDAEVRVNAALALWKIGMHKDGINVLGKAVKTSKGQIRRAAVTALAAIGPEARPALKDLLSALKDNDPEIRQETLAALAKVGAADVALAGSVEPLLKDKSIEVQLQAVRTLWVLDKKLTGQGVQALTKGLKDDNSDVVLFAALIAGEIGPEAKDVAPALTPLLHHKNKALRTAATKALKQIVPKASVEKGAN